MKTFIELKMEYKDDIEAILKWSGTRGIQTYAMEHTIQRLSANITDWLRRFFGTDDICLKAYFDEKEKLAKSIIKTLTKPQVQQENIKKDKRNSNKEVLNRIKTIAGNSRRQVQQTEIKLSQTDINRIQMHVTKYFNLSYSATEVKIIIPLKISANTDGTIKSARILDRSSYEKDKFYRAAADAARRAVLDSSPLPLPKGKEKKFQNFIFDFNTSFINDY